MQNQALHKAKLLIMASWGARSHPGSPLLHFVRDYIGALKKFAIHATGGTARSILSTGLFSKEEIITHRSGPDGGVVELAAMVASQECKTVIFMSDPNDLRSEVPENYALQRVCKQLGVRLITTLASAEQWAHYEADGIVNEWNTSHSVDRKVRPSYWKDGKPNVRNRKLEALKVEDQTLALIAHDGRKEEMMLFVNEHVDFLGQFARILTTGTTGYLIKLLCAAKSQEEEIEREALSRLKKPRFEELQDSLWLIKLLYCRDAQRRSLQSEARKTLGGSRFDHLEVKLTKRLEELHKKDENGGRPKKELCGPRPDFVKRIMPLPSGPKGGDILIAHEVLNNVCHAVVFFQDPETAQPHEPDIRLFERTCQFWSESPGVNQVYATCVSDPDSAHSWARCLKQEIDEKRPVSLPPTPNLVQDLRMKCGLRDIVIVQTDESSGSEKGGRDLARACAGYFHRLLLALAREGKTTRVVLANGQMVKQVLTELHSMADECLIQKPQSLAGEVKWSPQLGHSGIMLRDVEASILADQYQGFYGGKVETFKSGAIVEGKIGTAKLPRDDEQLVKELEKADIVLISAAHWNENATLYKNSALNKAWFPNFQEAIAVISAIFLNKDGNEVDWKFSVVGLDCAGLQKVAKERTVILVCGGRDRSSAALAVLRANLASVLVTTRSTATWVSDNWDLGMDQAKVPKGAQLSRKATAPGS